MTRDSGRSRHAPGVRTPVWDLGDVVALLRAGSESLEGTRAPGLSRQVVPLREALVAIIADLRAALFPRHFGASDLTPQGIDYYVGHTLDGALVALFEQVRRGLLFTSGGELGLLECEARASEVVGEFARRLPSVRLLLESDVRAAYEGDPAATTLDEAVFCYPGVTALIHHRLAHQLHVLQVPLIPRMIAEISHSATGIDIHPGARIGGSFFIDHGTGVVIGETCVIGERVRIYQGVTLGAKSFPLDAQGRPIKGSARHPVVEDDVVIYAGATILGRSVIGEGSSIGGNVWLTHSVPPHSAITQAVPREEIFEDGSGI